MTYNVEETGWRRIYGKRRGWAFKVLLGMRPRDLPKDISSALVQHAGALEPLRFKNGKFYSVQWKMSKPFFDWPDAYETEVEPGDWLFEDNKGGIVHLLGQHRIGSSRINQFTGNLEQEDDR